MCSAKLFPEPVGPITMEHASLLLIFPLLAIASSLTLINSCESALFCLIDLSLCLLPA